MTEDYFMSFAFPNFVQEGFYAPVVGGGSWSSDGHCSSVQSDAFGDQAVSADVSMTSTLMYGDLAVPRGVNQFYIPFHNLPRIDGKYRFQLSDTIAWSNVTIDGDQSAGAGSISVAAGAAGAAITSGDIFTVGTTVYQATADLTLGASATGSLSVRVDNGTATTLKEDVTDGDAVTCHTGDFSSPVYDTGWTDAAATIYAADSMYWGHPSLFTGKASDEEWDALRYPIYNKFALSYARYWKLEFDATSNSGGDVRIPQVFIGYGYQASINIQYGAQIAINSTADFVRTVSKRRVYDGTEVTERSFTFVWRDLPKNEAFAQAFTAFRRAGRTKQVLVIMDPSDLTNLHQMSFIGNISDADPLSLAIFERANIGAQITEVI